MVRDIIKTQRERGTTVFLNSHLLSEVEITCDRVAFIKHGQVLETWQINSGFAGETTVCLRARNFGPEIASGLAQWGTSIVVQGERISMKVTSTEVLPDLLRYLIGRGVDVYEATPQRPSLEQRFLQVIGEDGGL
jgi:ABC-2 type transport system ATP-binding protein